MDEELVSRAKALITKYYKIKPKAGDGINDLAGVVGALADSIQRIEGYSGPRRTKYSVESRVEHGDLSTTERHESFGMLSIARISGGKGFSRLYGSHLTHHHGTIQLRVSRGCRVMHGASERFHDDHRVAIVEVEMSAAQFAEAITTLNHGSGVPCTIRRVEGVPMEDLPDSYQAEHIRIVNDLEAKLVDVVDEIEANEKKLDVLLAKKTLIKADREEIRNLIHKHNRLMSDSVPFFLKSVGESLTKTVAHAKVEIESAVISTVTRAGLASIEEARKLGKKIFLLGDGDE